MTYPLEAQDLERFAAVLNAQLHTEAGAWSLEQRSERGSLEQLVTIYPRVETPDGAMTVVTVQSRTGYHQLFGCQIALVIEPDEVLFIAKHGGAASSLLVGAQRTCTLYANVPLSILQTRFEDLDPAVLLAAMQLSLAEHLLVAESDGR
ncbi:MAG: hypothetical protein AA908_04315 [Chlorobi bacterium NICIL-2]|nr:MAG: hypothetical protein AA908_04315 [Chlorobi bacterium NICIL-2]